MLRPMCVSLLIVACAFVSGVRAESTHFYCSTEDAAEQVAQRLVVNLEKPEQVVVPMIESGACFWGSSEVEILVLRKGKVFKNGDEGVFVAEFSVNEKNGALREFYALLRYDSH
jgi:hypothetical protein